MATFADVASYIYNGYEERCQEEIDETKLHQLVYLVYRRSIADCSRIMFCCEFSAGRYGPVVNELRQIYKDRNFSVCSLTKREQNIIDRVLDEFCDIDSSTISDMLCSEGSWLSSKPNDTLTTSDIVDDAHRFKKNRKILKLQKDYRGRSCCNSQ